MNAGMSITLPPPFFSQASRGQGGFRDFQGRSNAKSSGGFTGRFGIQGQQGGCLAGRRPFGMKKLRMHIESLKKIWRRPPLGSPLAP